MRKQNGGKFVAILEAEKARESFQRLALSRQGVGLLVRHHLQAMLDAAEKVVSRCQIVAHRGVDPAAGGERGQHGDGLAAAQIGVASAGNELLGLHEELDLADAAATELDIVALDRDFAVAAIGVNLLLHRVHVGDGSVVEIFAPDEGRQLAQQAFAGGKIARARARLDQRGALPILPAAFRNNRARLRSRSRSASRPDRDEAADRRETRNRLPCAPGEASPVRA